jgi:hypothetical protein
VSGLLSPYRVRLCSLLPSASRADSIERNSRWRISRELLGDRQNFTQQILRVPRSRPQHCWSGSGTEQRSSVMDTTEHRFRPDFSDPAPTCHSGGWLGCVDVLRCSSACAGGAEKPDSRRHDKSRRRPCRLGHVRSRPHGAGLRCRGWMNSSSHGSRLRVRRSLGRERPMAAIGFSRRPERLEHRCWLKFANWSRKLLRSPKACSSMTLTSPKSSRREFCSGVAVRSSLRRS